jgi:anaerobic ribonucleoside-triphosphate reductase activating protein
VDKGATTMSKVLRVSHFVDDTMVDGPGVRNSVYVKGCPIRCVGCQNSQLFDREGGTFTDMEPGAVFERLYIPRVPVSFLGGEPLAQPEALAEVIRMLRAAGCPHIIVYTGYVWEDLLHEMVTTTDVKWMLAMAAILRDIDVLVDGPFIMAQDDPYLQWRGSRNQRPIDVPASLKTGLVVTEDWDSPVLTIGDDGSILGAEGWIDLLADADDSVERARRCGQTRGVTR